MRQRFALLAAVAVATQALACSAAPVAPSAVAPNPYENATAAERRGFRAVGMPFAPGTEVFVSQGAFGAWSHNERGNEYSWDFDVPYGTPVLAVEDGRVLEVWEKEGGGGCDPRFSADVHNIKVEHADGTVAQYDHIVSLVEQGQRVRRGDVIAVTGRNGFICSPQLHFGIYASKDELYVSPRRRTIPVAFRGLPDGLAKAGLKARVPHVEGDSAQVELVHEFLAHPSDPSRHVELYWAKPEGKGPWPVVILLHGHQEPRRPGATSSFPWYLKEARAGYLAVGISQPGYGASDGPPDYCGPFTQAAVEEAVRHLRTLEFVRGDRVALYGASRGAVVAAMVATRDPKLAALVLDVGFYDMKDSYETLKASPEDAGIAANMAAEAGVTDEAFRARSALAHVDSLRTPALILTSEHDHVSSRRQARRLADALKQRGVPVEFFEFPGVGHYIPHDARNAKIDPFLKKYLQ